MQMDMNQTREANRASSASAGYLIKETVLFLTFCYLMFFANTWRVYASYDHIRFGVAALTVASLGWLALSMWPGRGAPLPIPLTWPLLLFLGVYLFTALTSTDPRRSLDEVWVAGANVFIFALTVELINRGWPRELFVKSLLLASA